MQIKIKSKHLNLSDQQKENIEAKVQKLSNLADRLNDESTEFRIELRHEKSRKSEDAYGCQLTIFAPNTVIRTETRQESIESAIDECMNKIRGPIERYKAKIHRSNKKTMASKELEVPEKTEAPTDLPNILRRKRFSSSAPMTEEEAIEHMELIGHEFCLFNNEDTGRFSVVYKRHDGYYGIVEPKMETD